MSQIEAGLRTMVGTETGGGSILPRPILPRQCATQLPIRAYTNEEIVVGDAPAFALVTLVSRFALS